MKRSIIKRRLLAESDEDQFDYQALLQKSRSNPVYVYLGTGTGKDKENGDAIRAAVAEHGGPSHIVWLTFDDYFKGGEHTPNIQKQYDLLCKLQDSSRGIYHPGWIFVLYQGQVKFGILARSPGNTITPWTGKTDDDHSLLGAGHTYYACDLFQHIRNIDIHPDTDTNLQNAFTKSNERYVKWRGKTLHAMAISPQGKDLTYDELLEMEPSLELSSQHSYTYAEPPMIQEHLKKTVTKRRLLAESDEDQFDYQALLQKSRSNPVYVHISDSSESSKEDALAVDYAARLGGGLDTAIHIDFPNEVKKYHAGEPALFLQAITKMLGTHLVRVGEIYIFKHGKLHFRILSRRPRDKALGPWIGIAPSNHTAAGETYYAYDLFQYLTTSGFNKGVEIHKAKYISDVIDNAKERGMTLHAMSISPKGDRLTYNELLNIEPKLRSTINSLALPPEGVPLDAIGGSPLDNISMHNIQEHLKRANLARKQGNYLEESIYRKLANNLLAERSDSDIYGIDPDEKVILSKWFSAKIGQGVDSTKFLQWFVEFMKNPDFVKQWDKEYGQTTQPLAKFFVEAKEYFNIKS